MIKPIADPITAPATELLFGKGHPELAQIAQLIDQQPRRRQAAGECPSDLPVRQAKIRNPYHAIICIYAYDIRKGYRNIFRLCNFRS